MKKQYLVFLALSLTLCSAFSQVPSYVPTSGLKGWWPFNGNANDATGNGNNGTVNGATLTTDRFGITSRAYSYDGNDYITLPNIIPVHVGAISFWFSTSNNGLDQILLYNSNIGDNGFGYAGSPGLENHTGISSVSGTAFIFDNGAGANYYDGVPTNNQWYHLVLSYDSNFAYCYINGVLKQIVDVSTEQDNSTPTMTYIGRPGMATRFLRGKFDDLGIWNRTLSQCEVLQLYNSSVPTVSAGTDQSVCSGTPVTLAGSGAISYSWDNGVTDNTPFTPTTSATYTVTGTDASGCTATDQVVVQVTELPTVTESTNTICPGTPVTLTASSPLSNKTPCTSEDLPLSLQSGLVGYWPFCGNANDESGNGNNGTVNGATLTADRFGNANNAYSFDGNDLIEIPSSSVINYSYSFWFKREGLAAGYENFVWKRSPISHQYCQTTTNNKFYARAQYQSGSPIQNATNYDIVLDQWTHCVLTFNESLKVIDVYLNNNYFGSTAATLGSYDLISDISKFYLGGASNSSYLIGQIDDFILWNRALTATEVAALYNIGNPTYSWSTGETTENISVSPTSTSTFTCDVTVNGQTCSDDVTINVNPYNTISLTSAAGSDNQTLCINNAITTITYATTGATGATVSGLPMGVTGSWAANVFTISGTPTQSGTFNYTVTVTGGCTGGTNTASGTITVNPNNTITLSSASGTNNQTLCINNAITTITYATTGATGATVSGLPTGVTGSWAANVFTISGTPTQSGTFNYTVTMTGGCAGGTNTISGAIVVKSNTSSTISPTVCDSYTAPDGTVYTSGGTYTAVIPNAAGCDSTITINLTVSNATSSAISQTVCNTYTAPDGTVYTSSGTYTAVIPNAAGCDSTITINLTVNNWTSSTISPTACDTYTAPNGTVYTSSGTYTAVIPNASGCDSTITINLTVNNSPNVNAGSDQIVCEGTQVILSATGASTYAWSNGVVNNTAFTPPSGATTYTVTGTATNGCSASDQVIVNATSAPTIELNASAPTCAGEEDANIYSQTAGGSGNLDYVWNTGATTPDLLNVGAGTYVLTVTDAVGCVAGDTVTVSENPEPCFSIPGGLSPNGDNVNDTWTLTGIDKYPEAKIKVFNRWGQIIWSGDSQSTGWDGTYEGKEMPTADYYYTIDLGNGEQYNGVVTLKR